MASSLKKFYRCSCYLTDNIFLNKWKVHIKYSSKEQFLNEYNSFLKNLNEIEINEVLDEIDKERQRRVNLDNDSLNRQNIIKQNYVPKHKELYTFKDEYLTEDFKNIFQKLKNIDKINTKTFDKLKEITCHGEKIYSFKVFTESFCDKLIDEIKHFESTSLPKGRPNSMNNYGVLLNELGFDEFFCEFREKYLSELSQKFYPEFVSEECGLDSHKIFIVKYKIDQDTSLNYHFDNAEVTLNVSLGSGFRNGELYFGPIANSDANTEKSFQFIRCKHSPTVGILHRGLQMHEADEITEGERYNLIIWMRSSKIRNQYCPMCKQKPVYLIESKSKYADGFTM